MTTRRLAKLAMERGAKVEASQIRYLAAELSKFPDEVIAQVCDEFAEETIGQYMPRWPDPQAFKTACRKLHDTLTGNAERKFYCSDCANEDGMLYFDRKGTRLRRRAIVCAEWKSAERCPCGGTETDWKALEIDRAHHPENYSTMQDVVRDLAKKKPDLAEKILAFQKV